MKIDIQGKVNEKRLAYNNTLLPLFEAIVNSIHAIEELDLKTQGIITITIVRIGQESINFNGEKIVQPVNDFIIEDNGVGFNEANYESFNLAHSTYKSKRGAKGIGRFIWLRAFKKAEINSVFKDENTWYKRSFKFEPTKDGIEEHIFEPMQDGSNRKTIVALKELKPEFHQWCNSINEDIAFKIIEHCFIYFLRDDCPRIIIKENGKDRSE